MKKFHSFYLHYTQSGEIARCHLLFFFLFRFFCLSSGDFFRFSGRNIISLTRIFKVHLQPQIEQFLSELIMCADRLFELRFDRSELPLRLVQSFLAFEVSGLPHIGFTALFDQSALKSLSYCISGDHLHTLSLNTRFQKTLRRG